MNTALQVLQTILPRTKKKFISGYSDFRWLKAQALDSHTLDVINQIEQDEKAFIRFGQITTGSEELVLNLKQGTIHTTKSTAHSVANLFVQIFKQKEHTKLSQFAKGATFIVDIGANEGYYALNMLTQNPNAEIICLEPNPIAFSLLQKNLTVNGCANAKLVKKALWSSSGQADLRVIPQVTSIGAITPISTSFTQTCPGRVVELEVATIHPVDLFAQHGISKVDILKMDIEGGEYEVLQALAPLFPKIKRIVVEYHSQELRYLVNKLLTHHGYVQVMHLSDRADFGDMYFER